MAIELNNDKQRPSEIKKIFIRYSFFTRKTGDISALWEKSLIALLAYGLVCRNYCSHKREGIFAVLCPRSLFFYATKLLPSKTLARPNVKG
jgi:hypothetical protein